MSLTDVMSAQGRALWQQIALILFFVTFVAIVIYALRKPKVEVDRWARLPIDDAPDDAPTDTVGRRGRDDSTRTGDRP